MNYPVFLMGTQRSGTTLLTRILSAHPSLYIQNEIPLAPIFCDKGSLEEIIDSLKTHLCELDSNNITAEVINNDKNIWGLKDPQLTEHIEQLKFFKGKSKFIIIVRDSRGVVNSYKENKWGLGTNAYSGALRWQKEVTEQLAFMKESPDDFFFIKYEDLVDDVETNLQKICDFLEIDFDKAMLNYSKAPSNFIKKRENINTYKKLDPGLAEKWKRKLSSFEVAVIEHITGKLMEKLGYQLTAEKISLSWWQIAYFNIHQKIIGEIQLQYRWRKSRWLNYLRARKVSKSNDS